MDDEATVVESCCSKNPEDLEKQNKCQPSQKEDHENGIQDDKECDFHDEKEDDSQYDTQEDLQEDKEEHSEDDEEERNEDGEDCEQQLVTKMSSEIICTEEPLPSKPQALSLTKSKVRFADEVAFESSVDESSEPEESYFGEVEEGYSEIRSSEDDVRRRREYREPEDGSDQGIYYSRDADSTISEYSESRTQIDREETSEDESVLQEKFTVTASVQTEEDIGIRKASSVYDNFIYYATKLAKSAAQLSCSSQAGLKSQSKSNMQSHEDAENEQSEEEERRPNESPEKTVIKDVNNNESTKFYYNLQDLAKVTTPIENLSETVPENVHDISFHYVPKNGSFYDLEPSGFSINFNFSPSQAALKSNSQSQPVLKSKNSVSSYFPTPSTATCTSKISTMCNKDTLDSKESANNNKTTVSGREKEKNSKAEGSPDSPSPAESVERYKSNDEARREYSEADADECSSVETIKLPSEAVKKMEKSHSNLSMLHGTNSQATLGSLTPSQTAMVSQERHTRHSRTGSYRRSRTRTISRQKSFSALRVSSKTNNHISEYTNRHRQYKPVYEQSFNSVSAESFKFSGYVKHSNSGLNRSKKMLAKKLRDAQLSRRKASPADATAFECIVPKSACSSRSENSRLWTGFRIPSSEAAGGVALVSDSEKRTHRSTSEVAELRQSSSTSLTSSKAQNMQSPTRSKNYIQENIAKVSTRPIGLEDALRMPYSERPPLSGTNGLLRNNTTGPNQTKGSRGIPSLPIKLKTRNLLLTRPANVGVLSPTAPIPEQRPSSGKPPAPPALEVGKAKKAKPAGKKTVLTVRPNAENTTHGAKTSKAPVTEPPETVQKPLKKAAAKLLRLLPDSNPSLALVSSPYTPGDSPAGNSKPSVKSSRASVKRSKTGSSRKSLNEESGQLTNSTKSIQDYVEQSSKSPKLSESKLSKKKKISAESKDPYYVEATPSDKVMINELVRADLEKILERDAQASVPNETPDDQESVTKTEELKKELGHNSSPHAIKSAPLPRRVKVGQPHAKRPGTAASGTNSRDEEHKPDIVLKGLKKPAKKSKVAPTKPK